MTKGHDKGHKGQMSDRNEPWDTTDMAHRAGGLSMEQDEIVPSDYSGVTGDYSGVTGDYMEQEPVAHLWECLGRWSAYLVTNGTQAKCAPPDYLVEAIKAATAAPPKREWQGLTDEEIFDVIRSLCADNETAEMLIHVSMDEYCAIEAKIKEKNT